MGDTDDTPDAMDQLFVRAESEGLWFFSPYQHLWFSTTQLKRHRANGRYRWGAVNWELRDPNERLAMAEANLSIAQSALDNVKASLMEAAPHGKVVTE